MANIRCDDMRRTYEAFRKMPPVERSHWLSIQSDASARILEAERVLQSLRNEKNDVAVRAGELDIACMKKLEAEIQSDFEVWTAEHYESR